jgi:lysophospholipase L1-like esterase
MSYKNCEATSPTCKYFIGAFVDDVQLSKYEINNSVNQFTVEIPIKQPHIGEVHEIRLIKLTESSNGEAKGVMQLGDLQVHGAQILPKDGSMEQKKKILVVGDSITAAYGVDGNMPCTYSAFTEDVTHGYASLVGKAMDAEVDTIAWSGKGMVRNYGDVNQMSTEPMPAYYNRTLATYPATDKQTNYWHPEKFMPNLVMIALGTNDFSTQPEPSQEMFVNGYVNFVAQVRSDYPNVPILSLCAPLNTGNQCAYTELAAKQANVNYFAIPTSTVTGYGCDYHPNVDSQKLIAQAVTPIVEKILQL